MTTSETTHILKTSTYHESSSSARKASGAYASPRDQALSPP